MIYQVTEDSEQLEKLVGYPITAMAYPCGGVNNDDRVADLIKKNTNIHFARTTTSSYPFDLQGNLLRFNPTVYFKLVDDMFDLVEKFLAIKADKPQVFYIWGHTYELDEGSGITWERFEEFCRLVSGKEDIFYGTNSEIFLK